MDFVLHCPTTADAEKELVHPQQKKTAVEKSLLKLIVEVFHRQNTK